jgi:hypothetical protein
MTEYLMISAVKIFNHDYSKADLSDKIAGEVLQ